MSLIRPPKSRYTNFQDQEKFKLLWNLYIWVFVIFSILSIYHAFKPNVNLFTSIMGVFISTTSLLMLKTKGTFKSSALFVFILSSCIIQFDVFYLVNPQKLVDFCWIITLGIFSYYFLGSAYGAFFLIVNTTGLLLGILLNYEDFLISMVVNNDVHLIINIYSNLIIAVFMSGYIISKIMRSSKIAELSYNNANELLKEQNKIVQAQNEEKTVMLKEIHHRVKNNLQVITSLLRLQSKEMKDVSTLEHFREAINRVMAMALIHDKLYQSEDLSKIDITAYLKSLSNDLIASYSVEIPVEVNVESNVDHLLPKSLVSVALLFNELISNSLKHGFEGKDTGTINIRIRQTETDKIEMWYTDNGSWKSPQRENSFGTELISTLTSQLDGQFDLNTEMGTRYHFQFLYEI